jgi:hypothetical protein
MRERANRIADLFIVGRPHINVARPRGKLFLTTFKNQKKVLGVH